MPDHRETSLEDAVAAFFRAARRARGRAAQRTAPGELSLAQYQLVEPLLEGPHPAGHLADHVGVAAATASRMVDGLVERGHLARTPHPDDRRVVLLELTPEGRVAVAAKHEQVLDARRRIAAAFSEDERPLVTDLLLRLAAVIEEL